MARKKGKPKPKAVQATLLGLSDQAPKGQPVPTADEPKKYHQDPPVFRFPHIHIARNRFTCDLCCAEKAPDPKRPNLIDEDVAAYVRAYKDFIDAHRHEENEK